MRPTPTFITFSILFVCSLGNNVLPTRLAPIGFHPRHSDNVFLTDNGTVAWRTSRYKEIVFSNRTVPINERIYFRVTALGSNSDNFAFGFTSIDPSTLKNGLPSATEPDVWLIGLSGRQPKKNSTFFYELNSDGVGHYSLNGEIVQFFMNADTDRPLWIYLSLSDPVVAIEILGTISLRELEESEGEGHTSIESIEPAGNWIDGSVDLKFHFRRHFRKDV